MRRGWTAALGVVAVLALVGCRAKVDVPEVSVEQLAQWLANRSAVPVDSNEPDHRERHGVVPGAVLLSSFDEFAPSELPEDKAAQLVFYCANRH